MKSIQKIARSLLCLLCLLCAVLLIQNAPVVAKGAVQGIRLCLQTVIPSLFCFMVLTCFLINSGLYRFLSLPLAWVTRRLFFLPPELGSILLLGMVGGYPMGAKAIASLLQQQKIDPRDAQRMMLYCCCAGPSFIISAVGVQMFGSFSVGVLLFAVQLGVSVLFALVCALHCRLHSSRPAAIADPHPVSSVRPLGPGEAFVLSVAQSVEAMGQMSGFIVLFSAVGQLISSLLPCASLARALLLGCLEVTNGCSLASTLPFGAVFASCFLSFGGLSVLAQIPQGHPYPHPAHPAFPIAARAGFRCSYLCPAQISGGKCLCLCCTDPSHPGRRPCHPIFVPVPDYDGGVAVAAAFPPYAEKAFLPAVKSYFPKIYGKRIGKMV